MPSSSDTRSTADTDDLFAQASAGAPVSTGEGAGDDPDAWFAAAAAATPTAAPSEAKSAPTDLRPFVMEALHAAAAVMAPTPQPIVSDLALALLSSQRSSGAYARFVPGEEIQAAEPWSFAAVDPRERAREVAASVQHERSQAEAQVRREMQQALARERQAALQQGRAEGASSASAAAQQRHRAELDAVHAQHARTIADLLAQFQSVLVAHREAQAQAVLALACDVARQVLRRELQVDSQSLLPVIHEALAFVDEDAQRITVFLHPDDLATAQATTEGTPHQGAITWIADPSLEPGGCRVQHGGTTVDATVSSRWHKVVASLGLDLAWDGTDQRAQQPASEPKPEPEPPRGAT